MRNNVMRCVDTGKKKESNMKISLIRDAESNIFPIISFDGFSWFKARDLSPDLISSDIIDILSFEKSNTGGDSAFRRLQGCFVERRSVRP